MFQKIAESKKSAMAFVTECAIVVTLLICLLLKAEVQVIVTTIAILGSLGGVQNMMQGWVDKTKVKGK